MNKLLIIYGLEGVGKTTIAKAIVPHLSQGASFDAENILQVNPFEFDEKFKNLAIDNSLAVIYSFFEHGYKRVVAGSFISGKPTYEIFGSKLKYNPELFILKLLASQESRDKRRIEREKPTSKEWRDIVDSYKEEDLDKNNINYTYIEINNSALTVKETIEEIKRKIPNFFN